MLAEVLDYRSIVFRKIVSNNYNYNNYRKNYLYPKESPVLSFSCVKDWNSTHHFITSFICNGGNICFCLRSRYRICSILFSVNVGPKYNLI